jgi:hypothetical protein
MADYVRVEVTDADGGRSEHSVRFPMPGMRVLDKPAVDAYGHPLPRKEHTIISKIAASKPAADKKEQS